MIDLAIEELPATFAREIAYCRIPLVDGPGNTPAVLRAALDLGVSLVRSRIRTLVCCSAGMSRSPCIAAGVLAMVTGSRPADVLREVVSAGPADVSAGLWESVLGVIDRADRFTEGG